MLNWVPIFIFIALVLLTAFLQGNRLGNRCAVLFGNELYCVPFWGGKTAPILIIFLWLVIAGLAIFAFGWWSIVVVALGFYYYKGLSYVFMRKYLIRRYRDFSGDTGGTGDKIISETNALRALPFEWLAKNIDTAIYFVATKPEAIDGHIIDACRAEMLAYAKKHGHDAFTPDHGMLFKIRNEGWDEMSHIKTSNKQFIDAYYTYLNASTLYVDAIAMGIAVVVFVVVYLLGQPVLPFWSTFWIILAVAFVIAQVIGWRKTSKERKRFDKKWRI